MNETCDRCGPAVVAAYRVDRLNRAGELYLCGHCASWQWRALSAQGWTFWPLGAHALAPQASAVSGGGPVQEAA
jgi:ribosomal protein S27AE